MNRISQISLFVLIIFSSARIKGQALRRPNIEAPANFSVNSYTGNLYYARTDLKTSGRIPIDITFSYNCSRVWKDWGMGRGWTFSYNLIYELDSSGIYINRMDGRRDLFKSNGLKFTPPVEVYDSLNEYDAGKFVLTDKIGNKFFFDDKTHKKITKFQDRIGNVLTFSYTDSLLSSISDHTGRNIGFNWSKGRLVEVIDGIQLPERKIIYEYDSTGNPIKVTNALGYSVYPS